MAARGRTRHWRRWLAIGVAATAVALVGGPYVFIHFIAGPAPSPLALSTPSSASGAGQTNDSGQAAGAAGGTWTVGSDSIVGYRVAEVLFGQSHTAVGRTSSISGSITIDGATVTGGGFTVDMATVTSDESRRDAQFKGRIMETGTYPTATFTLTKPIDLGSLPARGVRRTFRAKGSLTLHGVTRTVTFELTGQYTGSVVQVAGSIPITFADWNVPNPSFGPVTTQDHGVLEFALNFVSG